MIPLGFSDATTSAGIRVKAYISEYEINTRTQQMYSLDSRTCWKAANTSQGWSFAVIQRPSGAEVGFSLCGTAKGKPLTGTRGYRAMARSDGIRLLFPGTDRQVFHDFLAFPDKNGRLGRVGFLTGTNEAYTSSRTTSFGQWPGLATTYAGPFRGDPVSAFSDNRLSAVLANNNGLVRSVEYRYKPAGPTNRIVYYTGSKGFRTLDERGAAICDVRLVSDPASGTQEIWTGITTNSGLRVARKAKRRQWPDPDSGLLVVEQTDVVNEGLADAASNTTLQAIREFSWGWEVVEETVGACTGQARTSRWAFHEDLSDTNNYGKLREAVTPAGGWTRHAYDTRGREQFVWRGWKNAEAGDTGLCHAVETVYAGDERLAALRMPEADCAAGDDRPRLVVERECGRETARTYHSYQADREVTVRCASPGAPYDDPANEINIRTYVGTGTFKGRIKSVQQADGALQVYSYAYDSARKTLTTTQESGFGSGGVVTHGTRRIRKENSAGHVVEETVEDIAAGMKTGRRSFTLDGLGRVLVASNTVEGSATMTRYGCCGPEWVRDAEGIETTYVHDELKRVYAEESRGVTVLRRYDVFGNTVESLSCAPGGEMRVESSRYDAAGRLERRVDARGGVTVYAYATNALGETVVTTTQPDGATVVETSYRDGRTKCVTGTAVRAVSYDYGADERGRYTVEYRGADTNATEWVKTWQDMLGRDCRVEYADGHAEETVYDGAGRVAAVRDGYTTRLTEYNDKGEAFRSAVDMDGDGRIQVGGTDRVTETESGFGMIEGREARWSRQYVYAEDGGSGRLPDARVAERLQLGVVREGVRLVIHGVEEGLVTLDAHAGSPLDLAVELL